MTIEDQFLVRMEYAIHNNSARIVAPRYELFVSKTKLVVPDWMQSVSIEDNAFIHDRLMRSLVRLAAAGSYREIGVAIRPLIATIWRRRLPLSGVELWPFLAAHGVDGHLRSDFVDMLDYSVELLVRNQGRAPVKRRRMAPMARGRYLTDRQRKFYLNRFGHE